MRLGYVIIYVKDIEETVKFYEKAFALKRRFIHDSGAYAEMDTGSTTLAFADEKFVKESFPFRSKPPFRRSSGHRDQSGYRSCRTRFQPSR